MGMLRNMSKSLFCSPGLQITPRFPLFPQAGVCYWERTLHLHDGSVSTGNCFLLLLNSVEVLLLIVYRGKDTLHVSDRLSMIRQFAALSMRSSNCLNLKQSFLFLSFRVVLYLKPRLTVTVSSCSPHRNTRWTQSPKPRVYTTLSHLTGRPGLDLQLEH